MFRLFKRHLMNCLSMALMCPGSLLAAQQMGDNDADRIWSLRPQPNANQIPVADDSDQRGPVVTVRSAQVVSEGLNACELFVEPLGQDTEAYRVRLAVPESIKRLEIVPIQSQPGNRPIRVFVEQSDRQPWEPSETDQLVTSIGIPPFQPNPFFTNPQHKPERMAIANEYYESAEFDPESFSLARQQRPPLFEDSNPFRSVLHRKPASEAAFPISMAILGPRSLQTDMNAEFQVFLSNDSSKQFADLLVQIQLPIGLEPDSLDDSLTYDADRRLISTSLDALASGRNNLIQYRLRSTLTGPQIQKVVIVSDGRTRGQTSLETIVSTPFLPRMGTNARQAGLTNENNR